MVETLDKNEISPEQEAAIGQELKNIAKQHGVDLNVLGEIANKENQELLKEKNKEFQKKESYFDNLGRDYFKLQQYIGHRYLGWVGRLNIFNENIKITPANFKDVVREEKEQFNLVCKKYNIMVPTDHASAKKIMGQLNECIKQMEEEKEQLMKKELFPGKEIFVQRSSGKIEKDWTIKEYVSNGAKIIKRNPDNPNEYLQKIISLDKLLSLN